MCPKCRDADTDAAPSNPPPGPPAQPSQNAVDPAGASEAAGEAQNEGNLFTGLLACVQQTVHHLADQVRPGKACTALCDDDPVHANCIESRVDN